MCNKSISTVLCMAIIIAILPIGITFAEGLTTADGFLDVELENLSYDSEYLTITSAEKFSGGKAIAVLQENKTEPKKEDPAHLDLSFTADRDGTYAMWMRHTGSVAEKKGQNFFLSVQNKDYTIIQLTAEADDPTWVKIGSVSLKAGEVASVRLRRRQKIEIGFDRFIVSSDPTYAPNDLNTGLMAERTESVPIFKMKNGRVFIEAEQLHSYGGYSQIYARETSGGSALRSNNATSVQQSASVFAHLEFDFIAGESNKTYYLWAYVNPLNTSKKILVSFNGNNYSSVALGTKVNQFSWVRIGQVSDASSDGRINVRFRNATTDYLLDSFVIMDDVMSQPQGNYGDLITRDTMLHTSPYSIPDKIPSGHPRVYFTKADIPQIVNNAKKSQNEMAWRYHLSNLDTAHSEGFTARLAPPSSGSNSSDSILGILESLAFDYAVTGNQKNGLLAIDEMKNYLQTVVLAGGFDDTYTRPGGHVVFTTAQVYDWCHELMSEEMKSYYIIRCIEIIGDGMEIRWPPNGMQAVTGHGAEAMLQRDVLAFAIAIADERPDIYKYVMGRILDEYVNIRKFVSASHWNFQGSHYAGYRGQWDFNAMWILNKIGYPDIYGTDFQYVPYYFLYARRPDGMIIADGDVAIFDKNVGKYSNNYFDARALLLSSSYFNDPYLKLEYAKSNKKLSMFAYGHGYTSPVEFLCFNNPDLEGISQETLPLVSYYASPMGAMIARTGWDDGLDSSAAITMMKINEYWLGNHQHVDSGHFQIYYKGILANDAGAYRGGLYNSDHVKIFAKRSVAHNTVEVVNPNESLVFQGSQSTVTGGQTRPGDGAQASDYNQVLNNNKIGSVEGHEIGENNEYAYLKGDLTKAYSAATVSDYERSFMHYRLDEEESPMALVVFDRVTSTNESFEKSWLLHGPSMAEFDSTNNRTVFKNQQQGYNGKLTVDTLLPKIGNTRVEIIGGEGQDAFVAGKNYSALTDSTFASAYSDPEKNHEFMDYRIELSPVSRQKTDYFLNVLQVGDAKTNVNADGTIPLQVTCIENDKCAGAIISDRVVVFQKEKGRTVSNISFKFDNLGDYKIAVVDVSEGLWSIECNGKNIGETIATKDGGMLHFNGKAGEYNLTYLGNSSEQVTIQTNENSVVETYSEPKGKVEILIDDKVNYAPIPPVEQKGVLMLPLRSICTQIGYSVGWNNNQVILKTADKSIVVTPGDGYALVNGEKVELSVPVEVKDSTAMASAEFMYKALGCVSEFDKYANRIYIYTNIKGAKMTDDGNIIYLATHDIDNILPVYSIMESPSEEGNGVIKALDGDFSTRWASEGDQYQSWAILDLGEVKQLDKIYLSYHNGATRTYYFDIAVSEDGTNFKKVIKGGATSGTTNELEEYSLNSVKARYVKYLGNMNTVNRWNSITEIVITGR